MSDVVYDMTFDWPPFKISLDDMENWLRANAGPGYVGNSADDKLTLHFNVTPDPAIGTAIKMKWSSLTPQSTEAKNYKSNDEIKAKIEQAKTDAISALAQATKLSVQQIKDLLS